MLRQCACATLVTAVLGFLCAPSAAPPPGDARPAPTAERGFRSPRPAESDRKAIVYSRYASINWPKLGNPRPGEWLSVRREPGQTYEEYVQEARNVKSATRDTIYLLPFGRMDQGTYTVVGQMGRFAHAFFGCKVTILPPVRLPADAYVRRRGQYNAIDLLERMARSVPRDALALVGVTTEDLYGGNLAFVFGLASLHGRVAISSLRRFGTPGTPEFLRRALKNFAHETGHVLGIRHCIFYRCCMNGSNSLAEIDRQPLHCCPLCHDKLRHALAFEPEERFTNLAAFYDRIGFYGDARLVRKRLANLVAAAKEGP